jgi:hypothetical protein
VFRLITLALAVLCVVGLLLTNPSQEAHEQTLHASAEPEPIEKGLLKRIVRQVDKDAAPEPPQYHNYGLFSTTVQSGKVKSVGLFSHVWEVK